MAEDEQIPADALTAYGAREQLPELSAWMSDDMLKMLSLWRGSTFEAESEYFDLNNPERGPFVATGEEGPPGDHSYVRCSDASEDAWTQLITWRRPLSDDQAEALQEQLRRFGPQDARSAAGQAEG